MRLSRAGLTRKDLGPGRVLVVILSLTAVAILGLALGPGRSSSGPVGGPPVEITIPPGATFQVVVDTLAARGLVGRPGLFKTFARLRGDDTEVRSGRYAFPPGARWSRILEDLTVGRVLTETLTIPEGFTLKQMAPRIAKITGLDGDTVLRRLTVESAEADWGTPGPGLEGYLFPDTYRFAAGAPIREVVGAMVAAYEGVWTPERLARLQALSMTRAELTTLASIVQAEARLRDEMPIIASVYHNRLNRNHPLQADPTVLYALGGPRARLLYAAMDSVADHPYNTYTHPGLPPGPIGAPGMAAIDASLNPAETDFFYFVAHPDGNHIFSRTLTEHNRAVALTRGEWDRWRREQAQGSR